MKKFGLFVVRHRIAVIIISGILLAISGIFSLFTTTNYDMLSYLPEDLDSVKGNAILADEFGLSDAVYVLVYDRELWDTARLKEDIAALPGVKKIDWIDDFASVSVPESFILPEVKDKFIAGRSTILQIQLSGNKENDENGLTIEEIKGMLDNKTYLGGQPVLAYELKKTIDSEKTIYFIIGAVAIFIILSMSTSSFFEPVVLFISLGAAILFNMGTNAFLSSVSYTTSSVGAIIQLAVSVDYSIFLLHRYREEKQKHLNREQAMAAAISGTGTAVIASALTTIAGFASLTVMKIGIGRDLGFVMAKGVFFSLLTSVLILPCLVLLFDRLMEKTRHRVLMPRFNLVSRWSVKGRWVFFALIVLLIFPAYFAQENLSYYSSMEKSLPENAQAVQATEKIKKDFGSGEIIYLVSENTDRLKENRLTEEIKAIDNVSSVMGIAAQVQNSIPDSFIPDKLTSQFRKSGYSYLAVQVKTGVEDKDTIETINKINELAAKEFGKDFYLTGEAVLQKDMMDLSVTDMRYVNYLSTGLIALVIAISFRSLFIPVILVSVIQLAIWINLSIPYLGGNPVYFLTSIFIGAIQLGTTVDYAILMTSRYKENLSFHEPLEAMRKTVKETGPSILTSALILFAGTLAITLISKIETTSELTNMIGRGALISMAIIFFGLPSLLLIFNKVISWTTLGWPGRKGIMKKSKNFKKGE